MEKRKGKVTQMTRYTNTRLPRALQRSHYSQFNPNLNLGTSCSMFLFLFFFLSCFSSTHALLFLLFIPCGSHSSFTHSLTHAYILTHTTPTRRVFFIFSPLCSSSFQHSSIFFLFFIIIIFYYNNFYTTPGIIIHMHLLENLGN